MNRLDTASRARILACLSEGLGVRPTSRVTGVAVNTIQKLIRDVGAACLDFHDNYVRDLPCRKIQADEMWAFVYSRNRNVPKEKRGQWGVGDVWLWSTICDETKIVPAWRYAPRDVEGAIGLLNDLACRLKYRIELNTDGLTAYQTGVSVAFQGEIDYAKIVKVYRTPNGRWNSMENRYAQPEVVSVKREAICGNPDVGAASTSYVERLNLTTRQQNRKMSRLTNGHAKNLTMLELSTAIQFTFYNWCRPHTALPKGTTPAMAAGIASKPWPLADLVTLADDRGAG